MVDVFDVTQYSRTNEELEEFLLFSIAVAGKKATTVEKALFRFLHFQMDTPFELIRRYIREGTLQRKIKDARLGQYTKLTKAFTEVVNAKLNLRTCTAEDLEKIHGIGFKTSRFFIVHTRPEQQYAVLDTHILHYMRDLGFDVPESTPGNLKQYREIEQQYLMFVQPKHVTVADWDLYIWSMYSTGEGQKITQFVNRFWSHEL